MYYRFSGLAINAAVIAIFVIFVIVDTAEDRNRLYSALGILILVLIGAVISKNPGRIVWRHVMWGIALQFIFGLLILRTDAGTAVFDCFGEKV